MIRYLFAIVGAFACACVLAQDVVIPASLKTEPGRLLKIEATSKGTVIRWLNPDPDNLDLIPSESGRWIIVSSRQPGTYRIATWTAIDGVPSEAAICVLVVGNPVPPKPPTPPGPPPDPLQVEFQRLYDADANPSELKRQVRDRLAALYKVASGITSDPQHLTTGMLAAAITRNAAGIGEGLTDIKKRCGSLTVDVMGSDPTYELTPAKRKAGAELFGKIAKALEGLQ